ncbi:MAG: branched-chain amino acid ABC transporter permease [Thaumarchaeota archaeon]|nr:branched-chain amino acid ABC transporter permease [Nitrososphaerota archaeon]
MKRNLAPMYLLVSLAFGAILPVFYKQPYFYFASYIVLQYVALSVAWNLLGGYGGYLNFGTSAFFGVGAYVSAYLFNSLGIPEVIAILAAGAVSALFGVLIGYSSLRLRGVYFAIATLAATTLVQSIVLNTPALGSAVGLYIRFPAAPAIYGNLIELLFVAMFGISVVSIGLSYWIENSWIGRGLMALRDDEQAAETLGVPTFRLKLYANVLSGFLMGVVGSLYPLYIGYIEPYSIFDLGISFNVFVMTFIGGIGTWQGPIIGALVLGSIQQAASVTVTSQYNLAVVAAAMLVFGIFSPGGLKGIFSRLFGKRSTGTVN